jgi:hypothetical protein
MATGRVESSGDLESSRDLESFGMKREMTWGGLLFIDSKNISIGSSFKPLLIVLEYGPKQFWFKTIADEGIISSSSKL